MAKTVGPALPLQRSPTHSMDMVLSPPAGAKTRPTPEPKSCQKRNQKVGQKCVPDSGTPTGKMVFHVPKNGTGFGPRRWTAHTTQTESGDQHDAQYGHHPSAASVSHRAPVQRQHMWVNSYVSQSTVLHPRAHAQCTCMVCRSALIEAARHSSAGFRTCEVPST